MVIVFAEYEIDLTCTQAVQYQLEKDDDGRGRMKEIVCLCFMLRFL